MFGFQPVPLPHVYTKPYCCCDLDVGWTCGTSSNNPFILATTLFTPVNYNLWDCIGGVFRKEVLNFAVTVGQLPPSLTLSSDGIISGTPDCDDVGEYYFTIEASYKTEYCPNATLSYPAYFATQFYCTAAQGVDDEFTYEVNDFISIDLRDYTTNAITTCGPVEYDSDQASLTIDGNDGYTLSGSFGSIGTYNVDVDVRNSCQDLFSSSDQIHFVFNII